MTGRERAPDELSVVGYDNIPFAEFLSLTTMWQRHDQLARNAATLLLEELRTGVRAAEKVVLQPELVVRSSSGARGSAAARERRRPPGRDGAFAAARSAAFAAAPAAFAAAPAAFSSTLRACPGPHGIGDLGEPRHTTSSTGWLPAGQSLWQVLPLGPTGYGDSPYACFSSFAGNPLLISLDSLAAVGPRRADGPRRCCPRFPEARSTTAP